MSTISSKTLASPPNGKTTERKNALLRLKTIMLLPHCSRAVTDNNMQHHNFIKSLDAANDAREMQRALLKAYNARPRPQDHLLSDAMDIDSLQQPIRSDASLSGSNIVPMETDSLPVTTAPDHKVTVYT